MKPEEIKVAFAKSLEGPAQAPDLNELAAEAAPGFKVHGTYGDFDLKGYVELQTTIVKAFSGLQYHLGKMILEGDTIAMRYTASGTHKGEFLGIPATGKKVTYNVTSFWRLAGDKVAEGWILSDVYSLLQQLGAVPKLGKK